MSELPYRPHVWMGEDHDAHVRDYQRLETVIVYNPQFIDPRDLGMDLIPLRNAPVSMAAQLQAHRNGYYKHDWASTIASSGMRAMSFLTKP